MSITLDILLALLSLAIILFTLLLVFILCRKKKTKEPVIRDEKAAGWGLCMQPYSLVDVDAATDGFNDRRIVGKGRLGTVYAASTSDGELVAVKRIHPRLVLSHAGLRFSSTLKWLAAANHPNVVPVIGFSEGAGERILVTEFQGMMSLEFYLRDGACLLDWSRRFRVAAGAARGLEYLHELMTPPVVHGCVKPSNILIDVKFGARLCDYGLSFVAPNEKEGLVGYVDEEFWGGGGGSKESDVYGLGVVLLELLSGRRSEGGLIVEWGLPLIKERKMKEVLDPRLVVPSDLKPLERLGKVALACVGNSRRNRPSIGQVVTILSDLEDETMHYSIDGPLYM